MYPDLLNSLCEEPLVTQIERYFSPEWPTLEDVFPPPMAWFSSQVHRDFDSCLLASYTISSKVGQSRSGALPRDRPVPEYASGVVVL